jgi:hypothetical protein
MTKSRDLANAATALNAVTATELGFVDGVTSAIQTQMDTKLATATAATTYVANSLADAKGDLLTATADNTPARLAVGNNGETLVADSSTSTGLRYQATQAAGRNYIINGGFDIWQRGTSFTNITAAPYTADRYQGSIGSMTSGTLSISRQSSGNTGFQYALRFQRNVGATTTGNGYFTCSLETDNVIPLQGKTVTWSFYARAGANFSPTSSQLGVFLQNGTTANENINNGYTGSSNIVASTATLTTSWQRFTFTGTVSSTALSAGFYISYIGTGTAGANDYFEITGVQLELGSVATTFTRAGGTIQGELAACQRYYWRNTAASNNVPYGGGYNESTTISDFYIQFPQIMRTSPSAVEYNSLQVTDFATYGTNITNLVISASTSGPTGIILTSTVASGLTAQRVSFLRATNTNVSYLGFSAEL